MTQTTLKQSPSYELYLAFAFQPFDNLNKKSPLAMAWHIC